MYCNHCIQSSGTKPCASHISSRSLLMAKALFITYIVTYFKKLLQLCASVPFSRLSSKLRRTPHSPSLVVTRAGGSSFDPLHSINNCDFFFFPLEAPDQTSSTYKKCNIFEYCNFRGANHFVLKVRQV